MKTVTHYNYRVSVADDDHIKFEGLKTGAFKVVRVKLNDAGGYAWKAQKTQIKTDERTIESFLDHFGDEFWDSWFIKYGEYYTGEPRDYKYPRTA